MSNNENNPVKRLHSTSPQQNQQPKKKIIFRNYKPADSDLKKFEVEPAEVIVDEPQKKLNIVPLKPDADLKRDIESKLKKLERQTQKAIIDYIREKQALESDDEEDEEEEEEGEEGEEAEMEEDEN